MKKLVLLGLALIISVSLVACSNSEKTSGDTDAEMQEVNKLSMATGGSTGTYFPVGTGIANAISKSEKFDVTVQTSGGSVANMKMLDGEEIQLGLGASNTTFAGYNGDDPFEKGIEKLRAISALYPETFQFVVREDSGMKVIEDLKGKRVAVGAPGSGTERTGKIILAAHGLTYDDIQPEFMKFGEAVTALKDKAIDAAIIGSGLPTAAVVDASSSMNITLLEVNKEKFGKVVESEPYFTMVTIPAGTYEGVDYDVVTGASPALLITTTDLDEDIVYEITKALFENVKTVHDAHVQGKNVTLENALKGISIPLHPGTVKYYEEQGLDVK